MKSATLAIIVREGKVLLAEKKKGAEIGSGTLNGPGGKIEMINGRPETPEECVVRETKEEMGIDLDQNKLEKLGVITFFANNQPDFQVVVFRTQDFSGEPRETDAMFLPQWYAIEALPLERMLESDREWFAQAAAGEKCNAQVYYKERAKDFERIEFKNST